MSKKTTLAAGTSPFAHLLGATAALAGRALGRQAEDETPPAGEEPENVEEIEEDEPQNPAPSPEPQPEPDLEPDDEAEAETEEPADPAQAKAFRDGRTAERARCAAIFAAPAAGARPDLAATLAFNTSQTAAEAVAVLTTAAAGGPAPRGRSLDDRMAERRDPNPGTGGGKGGTTFAEEMAAAQKAAGR